MENLQEYQTSLTKIAKEFHDYCESKNLEYFMGFGTMLGAVRHQGFIPWDDDLDFIMMRKNYDIFLDIVNNDQNCPFELMSYSVNDLPITSFKRKGSEESILCPKFDVFPIDYLQTSKIKRNYFLFKSRLIYYSYFSYKNSFKNLFKRCSKKEKNFLIYLCNLIRRIFAHYFVNYRKSFAKATKKIKCVTGTKYCLDTACFMSYKRNPYYSSIFEDRVLYKFGEISLFGVKDYDQYLKNNYGDYMKIPDDHVQHLSNTWE